MKLKRSLKQKKINMRLSIEKVSKNFTAQHGKVLALDEISIQIKEGEFICFVGPSGCGKTTLLNMVAGLETPTKGVVRQSGEEIKIPSSDRVVIFQEAALFPWLNVNWG